ncbi:sialic acid-binding Ig-like lectin 5 isoform X2 [Anguilla anguilla]|uniref:sialic acid-binding Ig-like lectin 5 isoform X2 n=1 Tax=Anguilla anguilla TaxID=7936 RepID=UPI0015ADA71E|nr:sialic acid-binding Ig-like lectin 5 isoform X2 [Anguilla anguilla]
MTLFSRNVTAHFVDQKLKMIHWELVAYRWRFIRCLLSLDYRLSSLPISDRERGGQSRCRCDCFLLCVSLLSHGAASPDLEPQWNNHQPIRGAAQQPMESDFKPFTATNSDHNQHLTCTAKYQQVTSVQSSKILNVAYAPVRVEVEPESTVVKEGDAVEMQCSSDNNPPAHDYQWYNITGTLLSEERIYKLHNVSRHTKALYCAAINTEGHKNSTPAKISVEYAPEIKEGPACSVRAAGVACLCVVDSEPPPEITWLLQRGSDASAGTERHGSITLGTLRSTQRLTELTRQASNSRGNTSAVFTPPQSGWRGR